MLMYKTLTNHTKISLLKSILRIIAGAALYTVAPSFAILFIAAEVLGILEELPTMYKGTKI